MAVNPHQKILFLPETLPCVIYVRVKNCSSSEDIFRKKEKEIYQDGVVLATRKVF